MKIINFHIIFRFIGILLFFNAGFMLLSTLISLIYHESEFNVLLWSALITFLVGAGFFLFSKGDKKEMGIREGYLIVALGWLFMTLSGALPYLFSGYFLSDEMLKVNPMGTVNALFESVSGYTTTGASILNDIEIMPKGLLFWRSLTHWIGGMGIIVLTIAILPLLGIGGMQLFIAEAPGISADKLNPRITDTAKRLWLIYVLFTAIQAFLFMVFGMGWYDAVNHAMSTLSTGGFSTKNASMAFWNNQPIIQYITIIFMFLAGTNFVLNYYLLKGEFKKMISNEEYRFYFGLIIGVTLMIVAGLMIFGPQHPQLNELPASENVSHLEPALRHTLFSTLTIVTTTGFVTTDYSMWSPFMSMAFFALMFIGGMAGSTSGGVKIVRHVILIKNSVMEFKRLLHPNAIINVRLNKKVVNQKIVFNVLAFFVSYLFIFLVASVLMALVSTQAVPSTDEMISSLAVTASSLGNIGPAFGRFSPVDNFNGLNEMGKLLSVFLMLLGRLELFTVLMLFSPYFWRNY